ncbi:hypothetical protein AOLI_G00090370, partial [Acnodon oligacanthus]
MVVTPSHTMLWRGGTPTDSTGSSWMLNARPSH